MSRWGALVAVLALLGCVLFSSALFGGKVLAGDDLILFTPPFEPPAGQTHPANPYMFDAAWVFHPDMLFAREDLRKFELPVWNPYQGAGQPLLASQQAATLYPLNWLAVVFPFWSALAWIALLKVLVAGVGMLLFSRALKLSILAAALAAVSFAFSTYLIDWLAHPHSNVFVLLPWLMLAAERIAVAQRWRDSLLFAAVLGLSLLGGHPESSFLTFLPALGWVVARSATAGGSKWTAAGRAGMLLAAGTALGIAAAAIVLVPFAEMLGQSDEASRSAGGGPWGVLQSFVAPERWGRPDKFALANAPMSYPERTAYFGTLPLLIGAAGLIIRRRREQVFLLVIGLLALGLVVHVPGYSELAAHTPGLDLVNRFRALIVCCFCGAMLAGFGLENVLEATRANRRRVVLASVAAVTLPLAVWVAFHAGWSAPLGTALSQLPVLGHTRQPVDVVKLAVALRWGLLAALTLALLVAVAVRPRLATGVAVVAVALTAGDLLTIDRGYIPAIPPAEANPPAPAAIRYAQAHAGHERVGGGNGLQPNIAERFGLRGSRVHALPALEDRTQLWFGLGGYGLEQRLTSSPRRLASLLSVKYVFSDSKTLADPETRRVAPELYENLAALPRAWVTYRWMPAHDDRVALDHVAQTRDLTVPAIDTPGKPAAGAPRSGDPVRFRNDDDRQVVIDVRARQNGFLVLNDTYYPGWQAQVDGRDTKIYKANVAFRAVRVPPGHHVVRFDYRPSSVRIGVVVTLAAALVMVAGLAITSRRRPRYRSVR